MLDLYWLYDEEEIPDDAPAERYLGSLAEGQVNAMDCMWDAAKESGLNIRFHLYPKWTLDDVKLVLRCCRTCYDASTNQVHQYTMRLFMEMLHLAVEHNAGIGLFMD